MIVSEELPEVVGIATAKPRLLFVDDEPNFLNGIRRMLRGHRDSWEMVFANSVDEAVEKTADGAFDAIVSDVNMPVKNGLNLIEEMRDQDVTRDVPIIILTGNAETDLKRKALDLGATDLLNKPVGQEDLVARLKSVLRLKDYQDQLKNQNAILEMRVKERTVELEIARRDIIWRLAKAGEYRDQDTGDHVLRVACCSRALAEGVGLTEDTVESIFLTSPLHDLGKIGIPDAILLKKGPLEPAERGIMERHCEIGAEILSGEPKGMERFLGGPISQQANVAFQDSDGLRAMAAEIMLSHHEKWDGSGYPNGLAGEAIPVSGQIVAIADVYDALRSERPYKQAFSVEKTLEIMGEGRGSHFSPDVFDRFTSIARTFEDIRDEFAE